MSKINNIELMVSAPSSEHWPVSDKSEIVLAGRSNVGKSSLINAISNRKNMAYVGKTPGKTQMLNFFDVDNKFTLVDVPGYGYANISKAKLIEFGEMMEEYFHDRDNIKACVMIVDLRHKPTEDDVTMLEFLKYFDIPLKIVATKADKLSNNEIHSAISKVCDTLEIDKQDLIVFSSVTKQGVDELVNWMFSFA